MKVSAQSRSLAGILVIAALLLTGCHQPVPQTTEQPTATSVPPSPTPPPPTLTPTPAPPSALALLETANEAAKQATSYHFAMDMLMILSGPDIDEEMRIPMTFVGDVQSPDRIRGLMTMSDGDQQLQNEIIVIGKTTYLKDSLSGQWQEGSASTPVFDPKEFAGLDPSEIEDLELAGEDTLDGAPVYVLTGRATFPLDLGEPVGTIESDLAARYWIAQKDSKLVQGAVEGEMALTGELDATIAVSMTMRLSDYNAPLAIEAPALPIRAHPAGVLLAPLAADDARSHLERGLLSLEDDRPGLAAAHFDRAIVLQPELTEAYLYRGLALALTYDELEAQADFTRMLEAAADDPTVSLLAEVFGSQDELCDNRAGGVQPSPGMAQVWTLQAACLCSASEVDEKSLERAYDAFETARALDAAAADPYYAAAATSCFNTMYQAGEVEQIEKILARINADLARYPDLPGGYLVRAEAILWLHDYTIEETIDAWIDMYRFLSLASCPTGPQLKFGFDRNDLLQVAGERLRYTNCLIVDSAFDDIWDDEIDLSGVDALKAQDAEFAAKWSELERVYREYSSRFAAAQATSIPLLELNAVTFVGETGQIATISGDYYPTLVLWNSEGKKDLAVDLGEGNDAVSFSSDGRLLVTGNADGAVALWDVKSGDVLKTLVGLDSRASSVAFSPDAALVIAVSAKSSQGAGAKERALRVWDVESGELIHELDGVVAPGEGTGIAAESVVVTLDGSSLVLADEGVGYRVDSETGAPIQLLCGQAEACGNIHYVALSPDGRRIATAGRVHQVVRIWDTGSGAEILHIEGLRGGGGPMTFSPDGRLLAVGTGDGAIAAWDVQTGDLKWLGGHRGGYPLTTGSFWIADLAFSPDGKRLITAGGDGALRVWDVETGAELQIVYAEQGE